jgi:tetratricopeptide (TPR) repeat protein
VKRKLGRFELLDEVARGGMGVVYRARDPELDREVALKILRGSEGVRLERFRTEIQSLSRLNHPNVVRIHSAGKIAGVPYLVMALIEGTTLQERLDQRGPYTSPEAAELIRELALGLEHAHSQGVLHRDLKPENVLLTAQGVPLIADFGLALHFEAESERLTRTGTILGTLGYQSPEQASGDKRLVGPATDVYGLGGTLYAALTGYPPIQGEGFTEILIATRDVPPLAPSVHCPVDSVLEAICLRCLAKDPAQRYPSASALVQALSEYLAPAPARGPGSPLAVAVLGLGCVVVAGGLALSLAGRGANPSAPSQAPGSDAAPSPAAVGAGPVEEGLRHQKQRRLDEALACFDRALDTDPDDPKALACRGRVLHLLYRDDEAKLDFARAIALAPAKAEYRVWRASVSLRAKNPHGAERLLDRALILDVSCVPALRMRANLYTSTRRFDKAKGDLARALQLEPDNHVLHLSLCHLRLKLKNLKGALKAAEEAIRLSPQSGGGYASRAEVHRQAGRMEAAIADLSHAVKLRPTVARYRRERARLRSGVHMLRDLPGALEDATQVIRYARPRPRWKDYMQRAALQWQVSMGDGVEAPRKQKLLEGSVEDYGKAILRAPRRERPILHLHRGDRLGELGQVPEQLKSYGAGLHLEPNNVRLLLKRAEVHAGLGARAQALADYNRALRTLPANNRHRSRIEAKVAALGMR